MDRIYLEEKLIGERITLKKHDLSQAQIMFEYVSEDRKRLGEYFPWVQYINTVENEENFIKMTHVQWKNYTNFDYSIFRNSDGLFLGNIGVHTIRWDHSCAELGYWILGKFEGNGFISEAVKIIEKELFRVGFNRIQIKCSDINEKSASVPIRCGYIFEGISREDTFEMGKFRNTKTFSRLVSDK